METLNDVVFGKNDFPLREESKKLDGPRRKLYESRSKYKYRN